jgi:hypothetical protein
MNLNTISLPIGRQARPIKRKKDLGGAGVVCVWVRERPGLSKELGKV